VASAALSRLRLPGIFDGEHYFLLEPTPDNHTCFTHGELFSGLLVGLAGGMLARTADGFHAMNSALKVKAEDSARSAKEPAPG
jgi:hypothetical protein